MAKTYKGRREIIQKNNNAKLATGHTFVHRLL